jgi:hypothetical protein
MCLSLHPPFSYTHTREKGATLSALVKAFEALPPAVLEPFVGDIVTLLERAAGASAQHFACVCVEAAALSLLERLPARATRDYGMLILRAFMKSAQGLSKSVRDELDFYIRREDSEEEDSEEEDGDY